MLPPLTAVLTTKSEYRRARRLIHCLRDQALPNFELVMVAPQRILDQVQGSDLGGLRFCPVPMDNIVTGAHGWARGVRHATAPWVVLVEDHCFPEPGWAQALLRAGEPPEILAVGPRLLNGNPATLWSRVDMLLNFSEFLDAEPEPRSRLCGHNTCYRRSALPDEEKALVEALWSESAYHERLSGEGGRLQFQPQARTHHVNISRPFPFFFHKVIGGLLFGGARCRGWSPEKRAIYILGSPLIPSLRMFRLLPTVRRHLLSGLEMTRWPAALLLLGLALIAHWVGEAFGYVLGPSLAGRLYPIYSRAELFRYANVADSDRPLLDAEL